MVTPPLHAPRRSMRARLSDSYVYISQPVPALSALISLSCLFILALSLWCSPLVRSAVRSLVRVFVLPCDVNECTAAVPAKNFAPHLAHHVKHKSIVRSNDRTRVVPMVHFLIRPNMSSPSDPHFPSHRASLLHHS